MAYVGSDPELAAAAAEMNGAVPKDEAPAPKAKSKAKEEREPEPKEAPAETPEPAAPAEEEEEPPPAAAKDGEESEEKPEEKPKDEDEDTKVSKGLAAVARRERAFLQSKADFERRAHAQLTQVEQRTQDLDRRETQLAEREARAGRWEQVAERTRAGDYMAFFAMAEEHGITPEAAIEWIQRAPTSPADRAMTDRIAQLEKRLEEATKTNQERDERAKLQAQDAQRQNAQAEFLRAAQDAERYPFLAAIKTGPQILQEAVGLLEQLRAEGVDPRTVRDEQLLNYMNSEVEKSLRSNDKLRALYGAAPQQNGQNGAPATKPAPARTLTQQMTSQTAKTASFIATDDEEDAEALSMLKKARARDNAARV